MKFKFLLVSALGALVSFTSCDSDDTTEDTGDQKTENSNPEAFTVDVEQLMPMAVVEEESEKASKGLEDVAPAMQPNFYDYEVTWTNSTDPDGDEVTYDVTYSFSNKVTENATENSLVINGVDFIDIVAEEQVTITVTAKDGNGGETAISKSFMVNVMNSNPGDFTVSVEELAPSSNDIKVAKVSNSSAKSLVAVPVEPTEFYNYEITWTDSIDPDEDEVTYDVSYSFSDAVDENVVGNTILLTDTEFGDSVAPGDEVTVTVTAMDGNGGVTVVTETFTVLEYSPKIDR